MALFKKQIDPISDRSKALQAEIAALEEEIRELNFRIQNGAEMPRVRSTALPPSRQGTTAPVTAAVELRAPVFENVDHKRVAASVEVSLFGGPEPDLGVRNGSPGSGWRRLKAMFYKPAASNPKLVSYLAAGSIKGLRPLRYEKRVARNRFLALTALLLLLLWGVYAAFVRIY